MVEPPLPISALALRARNAKSAKERHDLAYFGWEASVRLAVALRPPADRTRLVMPSIGDWVAATTADDRLIDDGALLAVQRLFAERPANATAASAGMVTLHHEAFTDPCFFHE